MALYKIEKDASGVPTGETSLVAGGTNFADNPIGTILPYGGSTVPSGWFLCDGSEVSKTTYSELYAVIGDAFGTASVSTNFCLPDMRESVPKGAGLTGHTVGAHLDADGLAVGEFLDDRFQGHFHGNGRATIVGSPSAGAGVMSYGMVANTTQLTADQQDAYSSTTHYQTPRIGDTTEVKSVGVNYIIKAKMIGVPADFLAKVDEAVEENLAVETATITGLGKEWRFSKSGKVVTLYSPDDMPSGQSINVGDNSVGTIPVGFRPKYKVTTICANGGYSKYWLDMYANGNMSLYSDTAYSGPKNCGFCVTYVTD